MNDNKFKGFFLEHRYFINFKNMSPEEIKDCLLAIFDAFDRITTGDSIEVDNTELLGIPKITYISIVEDIQGQYSRHIEKRNNLSEGQKKKMLLDKLPPKLKTLKDLIKEYGESRENFENAINAVIGVFSGEDRESLPVDSISFIINDAIDSHISIVEAYGKWNLEQITPSTF